MKKLYLLFFASFLTAGFTSTMLQAQPVVGTHEIFPANNPWNIDISDTVKYPTNKLSNSYITNINQYRQFLHPDFGSDSTYGIPYEVVGAAQPLVTMTYNLYGSESDPGPFPIPPSALVEGGRSPSNNGDRHVLIVDTARNKLYEFWQAVKDASDNNWSSSNGATFDLTRNLYRPDGWTSGDAAGLPIFPGLVRYDEVQAGAINHALRFTVQKSSKAWIFPARHEAGSSTDTTTYPPMGLRLRLKAGFDLSPYTGQSLVILTALKKYGMIVADNGSAWFISGCTDLRWDDNALSPIKNVPGSAFEVVDMGYRIETNSDTISLPGDSLPSSTGGTGNSIVPHLASNQLTNGVLTTQVTDSKGLAKTGDNKTGIGWLYAGPPPDTTYNFNDTVLVNPAGFAAGDTTWQVQVQVANLRNNAHGALYLADQSGNDTTYYFDYTADSVVVSTDFLNFGSIGKNAFMFDSILMFNPLHVSVRIDSLYLAQGKQFSIIGGVPPQFTFQATATRPINMKFSPGGVVGTFTDTIMIRFNLFTRPLAIITGTSSSTAVYEPSAPPDELSLSQNAPNPFSQNTLLSFTAPESASASVNVYDVLGRQVAALANNVSTGAHTTIFNATGLPGGVYFARLQAGGAMRQIMMNVVR